MRTQWYLADPYGTLRLFRMAFAAATIPQSTFVVSNSRPQFCLLCFRIRMRTRWRFTFPFSFCGNSNVFRCFPPCLERKAKEMLIFFINPFSSLSVYICSPIRFRTRTLWVLSTRVFRKVSWLKRAFDRTNFFCSVIGVDYRFFFPLSFRGWKRFVGSY